MYEKFSAFLGSLFIVKFILIYGRDPVIYMLSIIQIPVTLKSSIKKQCISESYIYHAYN